MKIKIVSGIMLTLLLIGMLALTFNIQPVKASGTIYIRADGSVDPDTAPIQRVGDVYTFTDDISDEIVVERDGIVVDGAGYMVQGTGSGTGIALSGRSNVIIKDVRIKEFTYGISLDHSSNSKISRNNVTDNMYGIRLYVSSYNIVSGNNVTRYSQSGITLVGYKDHYSSYNIISGNNVVDNYDGIRLYDCSNNTISGNTIANNEGGIRIRYETSNNNIYHNNFIGNTQQVILEQWDQEYTNFWDDGYPSGGNYWSDYTGVDVKSGPNQDEPSSDGMGDTQYTIDLPYNIDHYPLMSSLAPSLIEHELVTTIRAPTSLQLSVSSSLNATVTNQGTSDETNVELVLLINGTMVDSSIIPLLQAGDLYTLSYLWTPTVKGTYNVTAYAHPVPEEAFIENNQDAEFVTVRPIGVKAGDWIKMNYTVTGSGYAYPEWIKVEILGVEGTNVIKRLTLHMPDGTDHSEDLTGARGTLDTLFGFGFIIPPNSTVGGDYVYIALLDPPFTLGTAIKSETTGIYAGANRTVVYTSFGYIGARYGNNPIKHYWDKQTGILVEASATLDGMTVNAKIIETNMWEASAPETDNGQVTPTPLWMQWWFYAIVAVGIIALAGVVYFLKKRKPPTPAAPTLPMEE